MKVTKILTLMIIVVLLGNSCKTKNVPLPNDPTNTDSLALQNFFKSNESNAVQSFSIDASNPSLITTTSGATIQFLPNSIITSAGVPVTGTITVKITEVYNRTNMILLNKPTLGKDYNGNLQPLISGGEINVELYKNDSKLRINKPFTGFIPAASTAPNIMNLFYGTLSGDTLTWQTTDSTLAFKNQNGYSFLSDSVGWVNCDIFTNDPRPKTNVQIQIPSNLTQYTSKAFIWFDGQNTITTPRAYSNHIYSLGTYTLPVGLIIHVVVYSIINGNPHTYISPAITITNNHLHVVSSLIPSTDVQFKSDLNNLP